MALNALPNPPRDTHASHHSVTAGVVALLTAPGCRLMENALDARAEHSGTAAEQELDAVVAAAAAAAAGSAEFPFK